jgi:uncharacterized membrane protein
MSQKPTIEFPMEPLIFKVALWSGRRLGPGVLEVNKSGMFLSSKWKSSLPPDGKTDVTWNDLRELKNKLRESQRFVANFGRNDLVLTVKLKEENEDRLLALASLFDQLPPETSSLRCPACSGPVVNNVCRDCGKSYTTEQRRKGFALLLAGIVLIGTGIILTASSHNSSSGTVFVFYGLMLAGLYPFVIGLIRLLFGVRAS